MKGIRNERSGLGSTRRGWLSGPRWCGDRGAIDTGFAALLEDPADVGDPTTRILVAGIGNIFFGDDGFGPEVMRHVPQRLAGPRVQLADYGIRGMHLAYDLLDGCETLILVDAIPDQGAPGTVHIIETNHESLAATVGFDAHAMDPGAVFASLNALGGTPPPTIVIGCEVANVEEGIGLSDAVADAVPVAAKAVQDVVVDLLARMSVAEG